VWVPLPLLLDLVKRSTAYLAERGIANARREAEWIFAGALGLSRIELYTRFDMPLDDAEVARLRGLVTRRGRREPLAYVLGDQDFRGLRLAVTPAVLVPRPETEELIDLIVAQAPARIVDIGTGSGAIALALKHALPAAQVEASDISAEALAVARGNAQRLGLAVAFHQGDLARHLSGPYDAIVANLPYIADDERSLCDPELAFEPALALYPGGDGLGPIRALIADASRLLAPGGRLWLEHGFRQADAIRTAAEAAGLSARCHPDGAGHPRFTVCWHA
jgi:release factor glutamine methyltransferase